MPKISSLTPIVSPDDADVLPIVDDSATETKKMSLSTLVVWLQNIVGWITTAMIEDEAVTPSKWTNPYKFRASRITSAQTITTATWTTVALNGEDFDSNSNFDTSTYKYTVPVDGFYMLTGQVYASNADGQYCIVAIYKNATSGITGGTNLAEQRLNYATSSNKVVNCSTLVQLVAGDTITLIAYIDDTTTPTVRINGTFLCGYLVSET